CERREPKEEVGAGLGHGGSSGFRAARPASSPARDGTLLLWPPSSSGLGLRPFTPAARVRIPLGVLASGHGGEALEDALLTAPHRPVVVRPEERTEERRQLLDAGLV